MSSTIQHLDLVFVLTAIADIYEEMLRNFSFQLELGNKFAVAKLWLGVLGVEMRPVLPYCFSLVELHSQSVKREKEKVTRVTKCFGFIERQGSIHLC